MLDLQNYHIDKKSQGAYIPILDKDPIFAAKFLSKEDLKKGYGLLTSCFLELKDNDKDCLYPILMNNILESEESFLWFVAFYKQMEEVLQEEPLDIHLDFMQLPADDKVTVLKLAAIIRVADALDSSRCNRFSQIEMRRSGNTIFLTTLENDIRLEELKLEHKGKLFTRVFGLEVKLESAL